MGRYIALGIGTSMLLTRAKDGWGFISEFDFKKNKERVKKELGKFVNVANYNWQVYDNCILLRLKKEVFKEHIHALIKEVEPFMYCNILEEINALKIPLDEKFNQENYPLEIEQYKKSGKRYDKGDFYQKWNGINEFYENSFTFPECWLFESRDLKKDIHVTITYILVASSSDKFSSEDDTLLLGMMNKMKNSYFKSPLARNMFFFIV